MGKSEKKLHVKRVGEDSTEGPWLCADCLSSQSGPRAQQSGPHGLCMFWGSGTQARGTEVDGQTLSG